mgnify:CR=1 FL=1
MAILTVAEVRDNVETSLIDDALSRLIDNADQEIIDRLGALASQTEMLFGDGLTLLPLARKASAITSATERIDETDYALATNDYELLGDGYHVQRKQGTNASLYWRGRVTIVYVPIGGASGELASRKKLLVDLVRLDAAYEAVRSSSIGDVQKTFLDHAAERDGLFRQLMSRNRRMGLA